MNTYVIVASMANSHKVSSPNRTSYDVVANRPFARNEADDGCTCNLQIIQGIMKERGSTRGAVTTDKVVVTNQITMKLIWHGDPVPVSTLVGRRSSCFFRSARSSLGGAVSAFIDSHAQT
jgi:hypothetical protein